ncbi:MAG TPA: threonine/serine exporter family protein, partial [Paludibacter sp.]|nr:threonine/serine exporter family protein [Paludibacter sp.]
VIRNTKRIAKALDFDVKISVLQKSVILTVRHDKTGRTFSEVVEIPALPISFKFNSELSGLSWEAVDRPLGFDEIKEKYYRIIQTPRMNAFLLIILVGLANASFCRLFKGDWLSMGIVFLATIAGFYTRTLLQKNKVNHYIVFIVSALVASFISATSLLFHTTSDIALATSVLFLIPGVPLINGVIDVVEGHTLTGISRLVNAFLLIVCIAIGLSITLFVLKNHLI